MKSVGLAASLFLLFLINPASTPAQDEAPGEENTWKGNIEGSYLQTDGNTETQAFAAAGKIEKEFTWARIMAEGRGLYGKSGDVTTDRNWFGSLKYDQKLTPRTYVFALETIERNVPIGIKIRYVHQGGLGIFLIKTGSDTLKIEAGAGYVNEVPVDPFPRRGFGTARGFAEFIHSFSKTSRFEQRVEYLPNLTDGEDYLINEESALITNLFGQFALKASFLVVFDNVPPKTTAGTPGYQKSDRTFKTALIYTF